MKRSPIRLVKKIPKSPALAHLKFYAWTCDPSALRGARFERRDGHGFALLHPSTKNPGLWQLTYFDPEIGPTGDIQGGCDEVLREVSPRLWRLRSVRSVSSTSFAGARRGSKAAWWILPLLFVLPLVPP